jgi:RimJ/RimL family protein N-acetyltransferase
MSVRSRSLFGTFAARPLRPADVELVGSWLDHPETQMAIEDEASTPEERRELLRDLADAALPGDNACGYIVERRGEPCGFIHLMWINWISRTGEVDLLVAPGRTRSAAGFAVMQQSATIAFDQLNLNKIYCYIYANNAVSLAPLRRVLTIEATMRQAAVRDGSLTDVYLASLTALQYRQRKQEIAWHEHER